ncbi:MAG: Sau3AI family type II restriction endonuclease [Candidatus Paceibacterota bacterium]
MDYPYDQKNEESIESYGKRLKGSTLRKTKGVKEIPEKYLVYDQTKRTKGVFGYILERYYYGIKPDNTVSEPDFKEIRVELKSTPIKKLKSGNFSAKERLVLNLINYKTEGKKDFFSSSFMNKNRNIMLVGYLHDAERGVVDFLIKIAEMIKYDEFTEKDRQIIRKDWEKIINKIRAGKAHELSEGDTFYLGACTKSVNSDIRRDQLGDAPSAKPRAYSFKSGFMTYLIRGLMDVESVVKEPEEFSKDKSLEDIITERFEPYLGKTIEEIHSIVGNGLNKNSKSYFAMLANRMLGVKMKKIEEFEKANVKMKTIRVKKSGMPKEDMSFPHFKFIDIIEEKWDADEEFGESPARVRQFLEQKFFFVVYECEKKCDKSETKILKKVMFWNMPQLDIENHVRKVWAETKRRIKEGRADDLPKKSDDPVCHIRPHGRNKQDVLPTPKNGEVTKQSFWLDKKYIKKVISKIK